MTTRPFHIRFAVVGLTGAGATSLIGTVSEINELENRGRTSFAPQIRLDLLPRSRAQWKIVLMNKVGILVVVDSTQPDLFPEVKTLMQTIREESDAPFILLANKQDHPTALNPEAIRKALDLGHHVLIVPCSARLMSSMMRVMRQLASWAIAEN